MIITEKEKKEIVELIPKHKEALVAYGADMYRQGIYTGAVFLALGVGLGSVSTIVYKKLKSKRNKNQQKES